MGRDRAIASEAARWTPPIPLRGISVCNGIDIHRGGGLSWASPLTRGHGLGVTVIPRTPSIAGGCRLGLVSLRRWRRDHWG